MKTFILLLVIYTGNGAGVTSTEFDDKAACEAALAQVNGQGVLWSGRAFCMPKSSE